VPVVIRPCAAHEFERIWTIINDAAGAYRGVVPADCPKDPYMGNSELESEMKDGIVFWGYEDSGELIGVMGIREVREVTLIRHACIRPSAQRRDGLPDHQAEVLSLEVGQVNETIARATILPQCGSSGQAFHLLRNFHTAQCSCKVTLSVLGSIKRERG